ncbi:MAG: hypothetical protein ACI4NM_04705 [Bullifex sp.]
MITIIALAAAGAAVGIRYGFRSEKTGYTKKVIYSFDFSTSFISTELGPGDTVTIRPYVKSESSVPICVFIKVEMPYIAGAPLYTMNVSSEWMEVENSSGTIVYAYGNSEMTPLEPGDSTTYLANAMRMRSISIADYAGLNDINATFTAYTMEFVQETTPTDPSEAWTMMKEVVENQQ